MPSERTLPVIRFDIPAGALADVLDAFERATAWKVEIFDAGMRTFSSKGIAGVFPAAQALRQALAGTGVTFRMTGAATATLRLAKVREAIEVSDRAPVASPRYTEPLRDIPQTISIIHNEVIAQGTEETAAYRAALEAVEWVFGRLTAGFQSARTKHNLQLPDDHPLARELSHKIVAAPEKNPLFMGAALPLRVFPPLFNRYEGGQAFGTRVDNAVGQVTGTPHRIRIDLSATLFLTPPEDYDGGELVVEDTCVTQTVKLPAGHMILYPSTSLHHVRPVTRGARISSFFWIRSTVRDDGQRTPLFHLDMAIQRIGGENPDHPSAVQLTGVSHNLVRMWAEI